MTALDVGPSLLVYFVIFYSLGYLLYSAIFAGVGAIFNSIDEAQQWNFVVDPAADCGVGNDSAGGDPIGFADSRWRRRCFRSARRS